MRILGLLLIAISAGASADEPALKPYVDPSQLDVPWPKHSFVKEPWRGFVETRSGRELRDGIGINYQVPPRSDTLAVRLLAETGIRAFRIEIGFGQMAWEEDRLNDEARVRALLALCRQYEIRPTFLLNAHQGAPCPVRFFERTLAADAPAGSREVRLTDITDLQVDHSGLNGLSDYWAAEGLITAIDPATKTCRLSKPLPKPLKAGVRVPMATLKYEPLHPVGSPQFDRTAAGWVRYARHIATLADEAGFPDYDLEIWNELTFGTHFLNINDYYPPDAPKTPRRPNALHKGGSCWELARRTIEGVRSDHPHAHFIWGFSNTTFFHTAIRELPPGTDGQSYHPYGTGTRKLPAQETHQDHPEFNVDGYTPHLEIRMPEGWAHTFIQTESLMRLLNPDARERDRPAGVSHFRHVITEHGVLPPECGVNDAAGAWELKALCATRSYCLWLNKGLSALYYFNAHNAKPLEFGILPADLAKLPADARFEDVATPPMRAIHNLTRAFEKSVDVGKPRSLAIAYAPAGPTGMIFPGDASHRGLSHPDVLAVLPFQNDPRTFVLAVYVMSYDATKRLPEERYRLELSGVAGRQAHCSFYDPHQDREIPVEMSKSADDRIEVVLPVVDHPRLLRITEE